jgi:hypothetical protein
MPPESIAEFQQQSDKRIRFVDAVVLHVERAGSGNLDRTISGISA